jgi:hypothetical protein
MKEGIYREVNEVSKEIDYLEELRMKLRNGETPEVIIFLPEKPKCTGVAVLKLGK